MPRVGYVPGEAGPRTSRAISSRWVPHGRLPLADAPHKIQSRRMLLASPRRPRTCVMHHYRQAAGRGARLRLRSWLFLGGDLARSRGFFGRGSRFRSEGDRRRPSGAPRPRRPKTSPKHGHPPSKHPGRHPILHARACTHAYAHTRDTHTHNAKQPLVATHATLLIITLWRATGTSSHAESH